MAGSKEVCDKCGGSGQRFETAPGFFGDSIRVITCGCCGGSGYHWVSQYIPRCENINNIDWYKRRSRFY